MTKTAQHTTLKPLANKIAKFLIKAPGLDDMGWEEIRDYCEIKSGSELDCIQLDILTDLVNSALTKMELSYTHDDENIYDTPTIAQSVAEDRR